MKKNIIALILLFPFSLIYSAIISLRNLFYETGMLKSTSFSIPVINVGEYLIKLLTPYLSIATLSRGYKRKSKGFRFVTLRDNASSVGDEPLQFKVKNPELTVAVSESRNIGIPMIIQRHPDTQAVLLDDAFQHRSVVPGLNVLLTEHDNLFTDDYLMPAGRLREPRDSYRRADIIIVTKCPDQSHVVLISAIANVDYLLDHLDEICIVDNIIKYEDHHYFTDFELEQFKKINDNITVDNSVFLTTEKDAMRLALHKEFLIKHQIPIFVLPIEVDFLNQDSEAFDLFIKNFLLTFKI